MFKDKKVAGVIFGNKQGSLLSLDEDCDGLLLPFSPRFRCIDFAIGSLRNAGITDFIVFVHNNKERVASYLTKEWHNVNILVVDISNFDEEVHILREDVLSVNADFYLLLRGNIPVWIDFNQEENNLELDKAYKLKNKRNLYILSIVEKRDFIYKFFSFIHNMYTKEDDLIKAWCIINKFPVESIKNGYIEDFSSIMDYYNIHMKMIQDYLNMDAFYCSVPIDKGIESISQSIFEKSSSVKNSIVGNNVIIEGSIENSVIFSDVKIGKGSKIKNSMILPGNYIGNNVEIESAIIDEFYENNSIPNIESHSVIGKKNPQHFNENLNGVLDNGLTLLGKNIRIPPRYKIGGNCYIESNTPISVLKMRKKIEDGIWITNSSI